MKELELIKKIKSLIQKRDFDIRSKIRPIHFFSFFRTRIL